MKLSQDLIFQNLQLIDNCGNIGLNSNKFIDEKGTNSDPSILIDYLLKHDLIERGELEEHFYLTDVGYDTIDQGGWFDPNLNEVEVPLKRRGLQYSPAPSSEIKKEKKPIRISKALSAFILTSLVGIGGYFLSDGRKTNVPTNNFPSLEGIQFELDSIKNSTRNTPVYIIESQDGEGK